MKKLSLNELKYQNILTITELDYVYNFYKKYKELFAIQYELLSLYQYSGKPSVTYMFIGAFFRVNEYDLDDLTPIYIFIEVVTNKCIAMSQYTASCWYNDMILYKNRFSLINNELLLNKIISEAFHLQVSQKLKDLITYSKRHEKAILNK